MVQVKPQRFLKAPFQTSTLGAPQGLAGFYPRGSTHGLEPTLWDGLGVLPSPTVAVVVREFGARDSAF